MSTNWWPGSHVDFVEGEDSRGPSPRRPSLSWIGVQFSCSGMYIRVFKRPGSPVYIARCPTCGKTVRFRVGEGGTSCRQFLVRC